MNILKTLTVVLALTVTATLAGCATATPTPETTKPEVTTTPDTTTQPEVPSGVDSLWSADEVSVLTKTTDQVELTVTVWDGKSLTGPTAHPFLGGGDFTITMPDEWYNDQNMIVVPFRIEVKNISSEVVPKRVIDGSTNIDTVRFAALEGEDTEYRTAMTTSYATMSDVAPGQSMIVTGYLIVPTDYIFMGDEATFVITGGNERVDASIVWNDPLERYMPREAIER